MITTIPNKEAQEGARQLCAGLYLEKPDGRRADVFTAALHEGLGWRMVALTKGDDAILHTLLENPHGGYFDARGPVAEREIGQAIGIARPYRLHILEPENFPEPSEDPKFRRIAIDKARGYAEAAWPDLPWKESALQRAQAFAEELETLCARHGFFIRSSCPGSGPILYPAYGDEAGFNLTPLVGGESFLLDRTSAP